MKRQGLTTAALAASCLALALPLAAEDIALELPVAEWSRPDMSLEDFKGQTTVLLFYDDGAG